MHNPIPCLTDVSTTEDTDQSTLVNPFQSYRFLDERYNIFPTPAPLTHTSPSSSPSNKSSAISPSERRWADRQTVKRTAAADPSTWDVFQPNRTAYRKSKTRTSNSRPTNKGRRSSLDSARGLRQIETPNQQTCIFESPVLAVPRMLPKDASPNAVSFRAAVEFWNNLHVPPSLSPPLRRREFQQPTSRRASTGMLQPKSQPIEQRSQTQDSRTQGSHFDRSSSISSSSSSSSICSSSSSTEDQATPASPRSPMRCALKPVAEGLQVTASMNGCRAALDHFHRGVSVWAAWRLKRLEQKPLVGEKVNSSTYRSFFRSLFKNVVVWRSFPSPECQDKCGGWTSSPRVVVRQLVLSIHPDSGQLTLSRLGLTRCLRVDDLFLIRLGFGDTCFLDDFIDFDPIHPDASNRLSPGQLRRRNELENEGENDQDTPYVSPAAPKSLSVPNSSVSSVPTGSAPAPSKSYVSPVSSVSSMMRNASTSAKLLFRSFTTSPERKQTKFDSRPPNDSNSPLNSRPLMSHLFQFSIDLHFRNSDGPLTIGLLSEQERAFLIRVIKSIQKFRQSPEETDVCI